MDDLRNDIRAAFEREQAKFPPVGDLRPRLVRDAAAQPRTRPNFQWLAVAAALMIGVLVVVGLMSSRATNRGTVAPPKPSPTAVSDYGTPPAGVPLVYVGDIRHPGWYIGFDWSGKPRGTIKLTQPLDPNSALVQASDGQAFLVSPQSGKGGAGQFLDRLGAPTTSVDGNLLGIWADDSRHFCAVVYDFNQRSYTIVVAGPNVATRTVGVVARDTSVAQTGVSLASCSIQNDRAVAVRTIINYPSEMWVVQLSTGKTLIHRTFDPCLCLSSVTASADGTLIAENSPASVAQSGKSLSTDVRRLSDGKVITTMTPTIGVLAFSSDDSSALVTLSPWINGRAVQLAVVDLATGRIVWQSDSTQELAGYAVEPAGSGFAIQFTHDDQVPHPFVSVVMVDGTGKAIAIPGTIFDRP